MSKFENDSLGTRMKRYEDVPKNRLTPRMPLIIRVDGRAFHTYTKGFLPFDEFLRDSMIFAAQKVAEEMQGFEVAYHQSDEVSFLLTDYATIETDCWFDYITQKVATISASVMTAWFNRYINHNVFPPNTKGLDDKIAYFDARAFNVPKEDVVNYFVWRAKDWERNSLQMYARTIFSSKELHKKNRAAMHEMLHEKGKNWAKDIPPHFRNGSFILKDRVESGIKAEYAEISKLIDPLVYKLNSKTISES